jgi:uncharacterized membrane protein required for colicin V production
MKCKLSFAKAVFWSNIIGLLGFLVAILIMIALYPDFGSVNVESIPPKKLMEHVESGYSLNIIIMLISCLFLIVNIILGARKRVD